MESLLTLAADCGVFDEALQAITEIIRRLVHEPRKWGDPVRIHKRAQLMEYRGLHWNLRCKYAVHERIPIVFLTEIVVLKGNPLFGL